MLGLWPLPERTPLQPVITGIIEREEGFRVEKLHFQSRPHLYVTGNLYLPKNGQAGAKLPAVLYVCGHSGRGRDGNKTAFQQHGMWFATHGYACLLIDTLQLGEIAAIHHGTYRENRWWWQARGYTPAAVECWNGIRAIDYLQARPEVDPDQISEHAGDADVALERPGRGAVEGNQTTAGRVGEDEVGASCAWHQARRDRQQGDGE